MFFHRRLRLAVFYFSKTRILDDYKQKSKSYSSKKRFLEE